MNTFLTIGLFFATILSLIISSFSIKCYQCNSAGDPECEKLKVADTNSTYYKDCTEDYHGETPFCRIYVTNVLHVKEPENPIRIFRSCGYLRNRTLPEIEKCHKDDNDFIKKTHCECFKDGCNSAHSFSSSKVLVLSIFVVTLLGYFF